MKTLRNADQEYQAKKKEIKIVLAKIGLALNRHAARQARENKNWGYVGDIGHAFENLLEVNEFLMGTENVAREVESWPR